MQQWKTLIVKSEDLWHWNTHLQIQPTLLHKIDKVVHHFILEDKSDVLWRNLKWEMPAKHEKWSVYAIVWPWRTNQRISLTFFLTFVLLCTVRAYEFLLRSLTSCSGMPPLCMRSAFFLLYLIDGNTGLSLPTTLRSFSVEMKGEMPHCWQNLDVNKGSILWNPNYSCDLRPILVKGTSVSTCVASENLEYCCLVLFI